MNDSTAPRAATLHDVAKAAGVSLMTVSRTLSNPSLVSDKTRTRVHEAVEATGYIPNLLAGGLKSRRSLMVAGIVPAVSVSQFLPTVETLTTTLADAGYQLILGQTGYDAAREESVINTMISRQPDGIVITGMVQSERARDRLRRSGIPIVETWDISEQPVDMVVGFSHEHVGQALGSFFRAKGWQKVGVATGDDERALRRRAGFVAAMGRDIPTAIVPAPSSLEMGRRALAELLDKEPSLQAVCCNADMLAHGVLVEAQARGLRVPQDLAVCGFGNADFSLHTVPPLSTVHVDGREIGQLAATLIMDRCKGAPSARRIFDLGFRVIERASTGG